MRERPGSTVRLAAPALAVLVSLVMVGWLVVALSSVRSPTNASRSVAGVPDVVGQAQAVLRKAGVVGVAWPTSQTPKEPAAWSLHRSHPPGAPFPVAPSSASEREHRRRLAWLRVTDRPSGHLLRACFRPLAGVAVRSAQGMMRGQDQ
jgi:hypothetical protein